MSLDAFRSNMKAFDAALEKIMKDRVSLDLSKYQREEDAAEMEYQRDLPARLWEAHEAIQSEPELRNILQDEVLAGPISRMMYNLEEAASERSKLMGKIPDAELIGITAILQSASQLEKLLINMAMGDE